jgi:peptide/nickel transport system permease protein
MSQTKFESMRFFFYRFGRNHLAIAGLFILGLLLIIAITAELLAPRDPFDMSGPRFASPSSEYLMGTDDLGRDIFSAVVRGTRVSLGVGLFGALSSALIGMIVGGVSAFRGGKVDEVVMRITEIFQVFPPFFLALVVTSIYGPTIWNVLFIIGITYWTSIARVARSEVLSLRERDFVVAARATGAGFFTIFFKEISPNLIPIIVVSGSLQMGASIILEAGLSFLGLGDRNLMSWGFLLSNAQSFIYHAWWMAAFPGAGIFLMVLSLNLVGDGLNDALNPKLKEK